MNQIGFFLVHPKRAKSPISIIISYKAQRYKISSGESIPTEYWNKNKQRSIETDKYSDCYYLNSRLSDIETLCRTVIHDIALKMSIPSHEELKSLIEAKIKPWDTAVKTSVTDYIDDFVKRVHRAKLTLKGYKTTATKIKQFEEEYHTKVYFENLDMNFYNSFQKFIYDQKWTLNYFGHLIRDIITFTHTSRDEGIHNHVLPRKFQVIQEESDSVYLTKDDLKKITDMVIDEILILENHDLSILDAYGSMERMITALKDCRDRFLIGCYTAMRYSDYVFLKNVKHTDLDIFRISQKTGVKTVIPMHSVIRDILKRRNDKLPPVISNQKFNKQIHNLCKLAKINETVEKTITRSGVKQRTIHEKWELVTSHTARRTGVTNMFLYGMDALTIMSFSGHKTMASFMKYLKATPMETAEKLRGHAFFQK